MFYTLQDLTPLHNLLLGLKGQFTEDTGARLHIDASVHDVSPEVLDELERRGFDRGMLVISDDPTQGWDRCMKHTGSVRVTVYGVLQQINKPQEQADEAQNGEADQ